MSTIYQGSIEDRVKQIVVEHFGLTGPTGNDVDLYRDLNGDSLDALELVLDIEDEFDIEIDDEEGEGIWTVQQAIDLVTSKVKP